jgi:hypothetical protein
LPLAGWDVVLFDAVFRHHHFFNDALSGSMSDNHALPPYLGRTTVQLRPIKNISANYL